MKYFHRLSLIKRIALIKRRVQQVIGREGETATLLFTLSVQSRQAYWRFRPTSSQSLYRSWWICEILRWIFLTFEKRRLKESVLFCFLSVKLIWELDKRKRKIFGYKRHKKLKNVVILRMSFVILVSLGNPFSFPILKLN